MKQQLTTQKADALLTSVVKHVEVVNFDVRLALHFIQDQIAVMPLASDGEILPPRELPGLATIYMLDAVIAKVQVALDDCFTKAMVSQSANSSFFFSPRVPFARWAHMRCFLSVRPFSH